MIVRFDVYFTNHLNETRKISDYIVDFDTGIIDVEINRLYAVASFVTNGVYYDTTIIGDGVERFEIKYQIDDGDIVSHKFILDGVDYLKDNSIRVYLKTKGILKTYKYFGTINYTSSTNSLKEELSSLLNGLEFNLDGLTDRVLKIAYTVENKSIDEIINDYKVIFGFEYYYKDGVLYFTDKEDLTINDAIKSFDEINNILSLSTSINKDDKKINKVIINEAAKSGYVESIESEEKLKLLIEPSPQACSPSQILIYTDDNGNTYKIPPKISVYKIMSTKQDMISNAIIKINNEIKNPPLKEIILVEEYVLNDEKYLYTTAYINELITIASDSIPDTISKTAIVGTNVIEFGALVTGTVKVSYKTLAYVDQIGAIQYPTNINFNIVSGKEQIKYTHKVELNGYYPLPYTLTISLIKDWGIDYANALNKNITLSKYDENNDIFVSYGNNTSNGVGEFDFNITEYGIYKFETDEQDPLYLYYFVNKMQFCMDEKA